MKNYKKRLRRPKGASLLKAAAMLGLGGLTLVQPETAIVTIPLIISIGKGK